VVLEIRALSRQFSRGVRNTTKNTGQDSGLLGYDCVAGLVVPDVSEDCNHHIFKGPDVREEF
jgi:hypothetical protein